MLYVEPELFGDELFGEPPRVENEKNEEVGVLSANEESDDGSGHFGERAPSRESSCHGSNPVHNTDNRKLCKKKISKNRS